MLGGLLEPVFYLTSIGVGLSGLVGSVPYQGHDVDYTVYLAPGLLASTAMNGALSDALTSVFHRLRYAKCYDVMISTPLSTGDVALGEMSWAVLRGSFYSTCFLAVMGLYGDVRSWWALGCLPVAALTSAAFATFGMAITTYLRSWVDVENVSLIVLPLFLFSGTFYPITIYPAWCKELTQLSPLYQGVTLERSFATGVVHQSLLANASYLLAMTFAATIVVASRMRRTLAP